MAGPDMPLHEQAAQIAPPGIPRPPEDLLEEPPIGLHGTQQLRLLAALDVSSPAVAHHPSREELVVTAVELVLAEPEIMGEAMQELRVLEDDCAIGGSPAGEAGETTVNVCGGGYLDVADCEAESGEHFPDGHA